MSSVCTLVGRINPVGYKFVEKCINTIEERGKYTMYLLSTTH